jgi:hypothetical protein
LQKKFFAQKSLQVSTILFKFFAQTFLRKQFAQTFLQVATILFDFFAQIFCKFFLHVQHANFCLCLLLTSLLMSYFVIIIDVYYYSYYVLLFYFSFQMIDYRRLWLCMGLLLGKRRKRLMKGRRRFYVRLAHLQRIEESFEIFRRYYNSANPEDLKHFCCFTPQLFDELYSRLDARLSLHRTTHVRPITGKERLVVFLR